MPRKLLLKRLTASDLTLFKYHFFNRPAGKQKAINMDVAVFVHELYPSLPEAASKLPGGKVPLDLSIYGPGKAPIHNLQRKILKQQKNWRLNGEYIDNPDDAPTRYNDLREGDYALFEFTGFPIPVAAKLALISKATLDDAKLHQELTSRFGATSMVALDESLIEDIIASSAPPMGHPIHEWGDADVVEDAVLGSAASVEKLLKRRQGRGLTPEDLALAKANAERTGQLGEEFVDIYLRSRKDSGEIMDYEWTSQMNAIAPYDFRVTGKGGVQAVVDAKSTRGPFDNPIHVSLAELIKSQQALETYDIYRLYEVTEQGAKLRIARSVQGAFRPILQAVAAMPAGVQVDGFSINTSLLKFERETSIKLDD
jgi:hypothetical protein